jgi:hypothetical protein
MSKQKAGQKPGSSRSAIMTTVKGPLTPRNVIKAVMPAWGLKNEMADAVIAQLEHSGFEIVPSLDDLPGSAAGVAERLDWAIKTWTFEGDERQLFIDALAVVKRIRREIFAMELFHAASSFCEELCEDSPGVPKLELKRLHNALETFECGCDLSDQGGHKCSSEAYKDE